MEIIDPKNTKERMNERLEMMYKLYSDSEVKHFFSPSEPITNADRIRSMTDEELADEILSWFNWLNAVEWDDNRILKWLQQEV